MSDVVVPRLIIGIGNPSRGDDAVGPLCIERLQELGMPDTDLLTDFQLQVEYALDLAGRDEVIFIDAAASGVAPFTFTPVTPCTDRSYTSHAVSPAAVLAACQQIGQPLPAHAYMLAIRGYGFELGEGLSAEAADHLEHAVAFLAEHCGLTAQPMQAQTTA